MDGKKRRNRNKKKSNHGKNDEAMASSHDGSHDHSALELNHHYEQNQNVTPVEEQNVCGHGLANAEDCAANGVKQNHNGHGAVNSEVQSIGVSESDVEPNEHKLYNVEFVNLQKTIKQLEDERNSWIQRVTKLEGELEELQSKVGPRVQNEAFLEEKLNDLQSGFEALVKEEAILVDKVKSIEDVKDSWISQETSLKEAITGLEEANKLLQAQVKVLEESSSSTIGENQKLIQSLCELESRIQALETKALSYDISIEKQVKLCGDNKEPELMVSTDLLVDKHSSSAEEDNRKAIIPNTEGDQSSSAAVNSQSDLTQVKLMASRAGPSNEIEELDEKMSKISQNAPSSTQFPEMINSNHVILELVDIEVQTEAKAGLDELRISEVTVPLDEIQIHEEESHGAMNTEPILEEIPLSDAPLIGAPFRLFSFVAKYVTGADLVHQNSSKTGPQTA